MPTLATTIGRAHQLVEMTGVVMHRSDRCWVEGQLAERSTTAGTWSFPGARPVVLPCWAW
jgi:hypothetical protein